jgi:hypothetical protein
MEIGSGADQGLGRRSIGMATCTIPKVAHGSAVEPRYIVSPKLGAGGTRKDFIWATVSNTYWLPVSIL